MEDINKNAIDLLTESIDKLDDRNARAHEALRSQHMEFQREVTQLSLHLEAHMKSEQKMNNVVYGNGQAGLAERVRNIESFVDNQRKVAWIVVPAVLIGSVALVFQTVVDYVIRNGGG